MAFLRIFLRISIIGGLMLMLFLALLLIHGLVSDRTRYRSEAVYRVSSSTAGAQQLAGPFRVVPWTTTQRVTYEDNKGVQRITDKNVSGYIVQTPTLLEIDGELKPDSRRIRIYDVRIYEVQAKIKAIFDPLDAKAMPGRVYGRPYIVMGVEDLRGLVGTPVMEVNGRALLIEPGSLHLGSQLPGIHALWPVMSELTGGEESAIATGMDGRATQVHLPGSEVALTLGLLGTRDLNLSPIADESRFALRSTWPHPSFSGRFLPNDRQITEAGFTAHWNISSLAASASGQISGDYTNENAFSHLTDVQYPDLQEAAQHIPEFTTEELQLRTFPALSTIERVSVGLVDPVDVYTQVDRATKYGILFIVLTFVAFMLFEAIKRLPIHPLQYLLVGLALAIFFLLLLSLSEHMAFWKAYLIAAGACVVLQFFYLTGVLKNVPRAAGFASMLTALYGVLYGLLISEDNASLMGSLLLFGVLGAIMVLTRKVDWYGLTSSLR